jgi:hypothetical protein
VYTLITKPINAARKKIRNFFPVADCLKTNRLLSKKLTIAPKEKLLAAAGKSSIPIS